MGDIPKLTPLSVAGGIMEYPLTNDVEDDANVKGLKGPISRKTRSRTPSPPPPLFIFNKDTSRTTWHRQATSEQNYIQLVVEREGFPNGAVIADRIDPLLLFQVAPGLQKRLEGHRIFLPPASCLDEGTIESMVFGLLRCAKEGIPVPEPVDKKLVSMMKMHCVLVIFEMEEPAEDLKGKLWDSFQQVELTPMDVFWIWDTFSGRNQSEPYTAPFAHEYVQMMAWQILNLDALGMLDQDIRHWIELEKEPKYFTQTMEARFRTHGLGKEPLVPETKTKVAVIPKSTETETPKGTAKDTVDGKKNKSELNVAKQAGQASTNTESKSSKLMPIKPIPIIKTSAFGSEGITKVFKSRSSPQTPSQLSIPSITQALSATPKFDFSRVSENIRVNPDAATQRTAQAGAKISSMFTNNAKDEKQNNIGSNAKNIDLVSVGLRSQSGGTKASNPAASNTMAAIPSQKPFSGFGQTPASIPNQSLKQPAISTNTVGFGFGAPGAAQFTTTAPSQPTVGLRASGGPTSNLSWGVNAPDTGALTPSTHAPTPSAQFNLFHNPNTGFQTPASPQAPPNAGFNGFGGTGGGGGGAASAGHSHGQFSSAGSTFNPSIPNAPFTGTFGTSSSNVDVLGNPLNSVASNNLAIGTPTFPVNTTFGGKPQQPHGFGGQYQPPNPNSSPFPNSFANPAANAGGGGNMFAFQGGATGSTQSGAMGGGMVRKIAKASGPKRRR